MKKTLLALSDIVHQIQKERGTASAYIKSNAKIFKQQLLKQFSTCDTEIQKYQNNNNHTQEFINAHSQIKTIRDKIINLQIQNHEAIDYYTYKLINPLLQYMVETILHQDNNSNTASTVYNAFIQWKENLGLERTLGTSALINDPKNLKNEFIDRVLLLIGKEESNKKICMLLASPEQKNLLNELQTQYDAKLGKIHKQLQAEKVPPKLTPQEWFALISEKMDILHVYEKKLIDTLYDHDSEVQGKIQSHNSIGDHWELLKSLPLFSEIDEVSLQEVLDEASLQKHKKGKLLVSKGDSPDYFYLILRGWVKVGGLSSDGKETVLQMLGVGDTIMEQAIFLNMPYVAQAEVVKDVDLLLLPASVIVRHVRAKHLLALGILNSMAARSQSFIWHVDNVRSKSAEHRLGWFLLRLLLEQKRSSRHLVLPYDKALIASYLGMSPETLSRALGRLKRQGFGVSGDEVTVPDFGSLCEFCDTRAMEYCPRYGAEDCDSL